MDDVGFDIGRALPWFAHDLRKLIVVLEAHLRNTGIVLSNQYLEAQSAIHSHIDGVDATLIELMAEEIGDAEFIETWLPTCLTIP